MRNKLYPSTWKFRKYSWHWISFEKLFARYLAEFYFVSKFIHMTFKEFQHSIPFDKLFVISDKTLSRFKIYFPSIGNGLKILRWFASYIYNIQKNSISLTNLFMYIYFREVLKFYFLSKHIRMNRNFKIRFCLFLRYLNRFRFISNLIIHHFNQFENSILLKDLVVWRLKELHSLPKIIIRKNLFISNSILARGARSNIQKHWQNWILFPHEVGKILYV